MFSRDARAIKPVGQDVLVPNEKVGVWSDGRISAYDDEEVKYCWKRIHICSHC